MPFDRAYTGQAFQRPFTKMPAKWLVRSAFAVIRRLSPALREDITGDRPYMVSPLAATSQSIRAEEPGERSVLTIHLTCSVQHFLLHLCLSFLFCRLCWQPGKCWDFFFFFPYDFAPSLRPLFFYLFLEFCCFFLFLTSLPPDFLFFFPLFPPCFRPQNRGPIDHVLFFARCFTFYFIYTLHIYQLNFIFISFQCLYIYFPQSTSYV